tara:strand:- start:5412 stop:6698 length:1287 start_codon:yes stop_codon:yes gene_type:complete
MAFLGMRGNGDWATDQRPKHWREMILYLYPNGSAPLTAMLSKMKSSKVSDPEYNWWTKNLASQGGAVTNVFSDSSMGSAVSTTAASAGDVHYVKCPLAVASEIRAGHQVLLRDASIIDNDANAKVVSVVLNGADSMVACKYLEDSASGNADNFDTILVIGSINAEGAPIPDALSYDPVKYSNYTQIFRTPLEITRTARKTRLRTGDQYKEMKREALELHSIEMEKAFFHGVKSEGTGSNGKPERTTQGIINFIKTNAAANMFNYNASDDEVSASATWIASGEAYLDANLEKLFRHGSSEKIAYCGSGALLGINKLAKSAGQVQLKSTDSAYGLKVVEWLTPFGTLMLKTHPLFSYEASNRNRMVVVDPEKIQFNYIDDTFFKKDDGERKAGQMAIDGSKEEFLTEGGLEMHHPLCHGVFDGIGLAAPS